ncbi:hypothetical protein LL033_25625 (plasmid) [Clostridium estertheticum]|uniref:hypothetical protein n=1 Tax=Clostridium estertheticum TaxID=238834 RepID=UPI001C0D75A0|nr:hypothetical protein [Clostridium estertheticum]MBU3217366.1 hypothetical protein [Clostridium estertheticum]WAG58140.1 hypothetical protein LL033_25625 [Clostridium estertheticum]
MSKSYVVQLKNLLVKLASGATEYAIESLADFIIPEETLRAIPRNNENTAEVIREVTLEDGTTFIITIGLKNKIMSKMLNEVDSNLPTYHSFVSNFNTNEVNPCDENSESEYVSVNVKTYSDSNSGGINLFGAITINW